MASRDRTALLGFGLLQLSLFYFWGALSFWVVVGLSIAVDGFFLLIAAIIKAIEEHKK